MTPSSRASVPARSADQRLYELVEEIHRKLTAGQVVDLTSYVAEHPEYAEQLRQLVPALHALDAFASSGAARSAWAVPSSAEAEHATLGDFAIVREIGRGGMGIVYEAKQLSLNRRVALKVLPFAAVMDPKQLHRFKNEAQAAAQLHHQNIVPIHFVGAERGVHFYAMQFIEGQSMAEVIAELRGAVSRESGVGNREELSIASATPTPYSQLPTASLQALSTECSTNPCEFFRTVARLGIQAAEALDHAHQLGIIHRDVKPSNLLLDLRGNLWVTDFGLARVGSDANITMTGDLVGTLRYMSPEQALAKRVVVDHRTDVYSLGVTLYELLTLRPVFAGHDREEILRQIAFDEPRPPRKINSAIPVELETIVLKAMAKSPSDRYATAQELADDVRRYLDDKAILARRPGSVRRLVKWSQRHKTIVWSAAAASLAVFAILAASIGWILSDREWRRSETERELSRALDAAEQFMGRASWPDAKTAISRADGLLVTGRAGVALRQRLGQLHADVQMIERLEAIRELEAMMLDGVHDSAALDWRYSVAFRDYGMDVDGGWWSSPRDPSLLDNATELGSRRLDPRHPTIAEAAEQMKQRSIRRELVAALDHWAVVRRNAGGQDASTLLAVARTTDPDELRGRLRDYLERNDREALLSASSSDEIATLPPASAVLLASALASEASVEQALTVLETAHRNNPGDLWIDLLLAENLHKLSRWDEMLRFAEAARGIRPNSGAALLSIADALRHKGSLEQTIALCDDALRLNADNPHAYTLLGLVHEDQGDWDEAVTRFRKAIELDPGDVDAHNHLGRCLTKQRKIDAAIDELRRAIELKPNAASPHENLGVALHRKGLKDDALAELHTAIELDPQSAQAHTDLGALLVELGQVPAGIDEHRRAIELDPQRAQPHVNLGYALRIQGEIESAIAEYREAIRLNPRLAAPQWNLAQILMDQGKFVEAREYLWHGHEASLRDRYGRYPWSDRLRECERMIELDSHLPAILAGTKQPADAAERAEYGMLCYSKRLYATAARFFEKAFDEQPELADDLAHGHRYTAACSAALAADGRGEDAGASGVSKPAGETPTPQRDDSERRRLRDQALDWLRADLAQRANILKGPDSKHRQQAIQQLQNWQVDPDLSGMRDEKSLTRLPEAERGRWQELWADVAKVMNGNGN